MEEYIGYALLGLGVVVLIIAFILKGKGGQKAPKQEEKKEPEKPKEYYGPVTIVFGSQTGTAANFAKSLGEEAEKEGFEPQILDAVDFDPEKFAKKKIVLFTMATHGEGDPPDNCKAMTEWMTDESRGADALKGMKFSGFGLGNKQYQFYNAQGKLMNTHFERLGAERVFNYGEGDDDGSLEDDFNEWKEGLWETLKKHVDLKSLKPQRKLSNEYMDNLTHGFKTKKLNFQVKFDSSAKEIDLDNYDHNDGKEYDFQIKQFFSAKSAKVGTIRELRQKTDDGSTLHVEINTGDAGIKYETAQNLSLYIENSEEDVAKAAKLLNLNLNDVFTITEDHEMEGSIKFKHPFPTPLSVRSYLTYFCDLHGALKKKQLKELSEFCSNPDKKSKLAFLTSTDGKAEFDAQIHAPMRGILDILDEYGVEISFDHFIEAASFMQPRLYTIASSSIQKPDVCDLCFALQYDQVSGGKTRIGMASRFMQKLYNLQASGKPVPPVRVAIKESTFLKPKSKEQPVIMVGPGAGIAPFKGFADEKQHLASANKNDVWGDMSLFFGCRGRNWDYLYKPELLKLEEDGILNNGYFVAFSRESDKKVYVQDLMEKNREAIQKQLFEQNGMLYICGSMRMGKDVIRKLSEFAASHFKISTEEGLHKIEELEKHKIIIKEIWG